MPLFRRYGRPGLLGRIDGRAVLGGTPDMIARSVGPDGAAEVAEDRVGPGSQPPLHSPLLSPTLADQLKALIVIHDAGDISDGEFVRAKARLLE